MIQNHHVYDNVYSTKMEKMCKNLQNNLYSHLMEIWSRGQFLGPLVLALYARKTVSTSNENLPSMLSESVLNLNSSI